MFSVIGSQLHAWLAAIMIACALPQTLHVKILCTIFFIHTLVFLMPSYTICHTWFLDALYNSSRLVSGCII